MSATNIVDFHAYGLGIKDTSGVDQEAVKAIGKRIVDGFKSHGFCYLKNHGVGDALIKDYMRVSRNFFEQPESVKEKYALDARYVFGWLKLERETLNINRKAGDLHEAFNYTPEYDSEWPPVENFETLTKEMYTAGKDLAYRFCDVLSLGLGLPMEYFRDAHKGHLLEVRSTYYPPIADVKSLAPDQARLGEHTDWGTFAFHFQDDVGGLEVKNPKGEFIPADPIPGTVVVTPSAILQRWTSDTLLGAQHRILVRDDERSKKVQQVLVFFVEPDADYEVRCIDGSEKYPPILFKDYWDLRASDSMKYASPDHEILQ